MKGLKQAEEPSSIFPFLSVLLCLIGALVLGVLLISVGRLSVEKERLNLRSKWEEYQRLLQQSKETEQAGDRLEMSLRDRNVTQMQLGELRKLIQDLELLRKRGDQIEHNFKAAQERVVALGNRVNGMRRQREELKTIRNQRQQTKEALPKPGSVKIVGTAKMVGQQQVAGQARESLMRQVQKRLKAAGFDPGPIDGQLGPQTVEALHRYQSANNLPASGKLDTATRKLLNLKGYELHPFFVECRGEDVIVHPAGLRVPVSKLQENNSFQEAADRVKSNQDNGAVLILMIRPDGIKTFDNVHASIRKQGIRYGFLPIPGFDEIDLSAFSN